MKKLNYALMSAAAIASGVSPSVFAQESDTGATVTIPTLVNTSGLQTSLVDSLKSWLVIGLAIGLAVFAVYFGWRLIRRFVK